MLAQHTTEELDVWSQLKEQLDRRIRQSDFAADIEFDPEVDGQLTRRLKRPILREVVLSFSSPNPYLNVHYEEDGRSSGLPLMLRVEGKQFIDAKSDSTTTVDDLVTRILTFLQIGK